MSITEALFVPTILFMLIVAPIWIVMHYQSRKRSSQSLSEDDRQELDEMLATVDKLSDRIVSLESILDVDHPNWRKTDGQRSE
ncbi:phage shock protein B [Luminiphilus syltensis NOR5-1B]|uniref:Phage shock protein B n=1 Tax=Luminiphilus syltensis NOR5-1B TaxID=565045 RepID=B8KRJ6_9GAMM|nr:envelope stress response membrane protein PspB [Luminiphilus syltensis]EED34211.1 phage shock protein B [Luminiphilus syltensis NOR5-1B]EED36728.1 phage shock protein B [Luminiphilus syltensis NOR5-1B]